MELIFVCSQFIPSISEWHVSPILLQLYLGLQYTLGDGSSLGYQFEQYLVEFVIMVVVMDQDGMKKEVNSFRYLN